MNKNDKRNEQGRSMVEMLGVLAIIGVLSVGGLYGYGVAMKKHKANQLLHEASMQAATISAQIMSGKDPSKIQNFTGGSANFSETVVKPNDEQFTLEIKDVDSAVCEQMKKMKGGMTRDITCGTADADGKTTATLKFNNNLSNEPVAGDYTHTDCPENFYQCDLLDSCVSSEEKCRLDCNQGTWNNETQSCECKEGYIGLQCENVCNEECQTCQLGFYGSHWDTSDAAKASSQDGTGACCSQETDGFWNGEECCGAPWRNFWTQKHTKSCCEMESDAVWDTSDAAKAYSEGDGTGACCSHTIGFWTGKECCNSGGPHNVWSGTVTRACCENATSVWDTTDEAKRVGADWNVGDETGACCMVGAAKWTGEECCQADDERVNPFNFWTTKATKNCCEAANFHWDTTDEAKASGQGDETGACCLPDFGFWTGKECCAVEYGYGYQPFNAWTHHITRECCEKGAVFHWDTSDEAKASGQGDETGACCPSNLWTGKACCDGTNSLWTNTPTQACCEYSFAGWDPVNNTCI